jgi:hypothetical protein
MPQAICEKHGHQSAELMTNNVLNIIYNNSINKEENIYFVTLIYEEFIFSGFATNSDLVTLNKMGGETDANGDYNFSKEEEIEKALELFTAICSRCLSDSGVKIPSC